MCDTPPLPAEDNGNTAINNKFTLEDDPTKETGVEMMPELPLDREDALEADSIVHSPNALDKDKPKNSKRNTASSTRLTRSRDNPEFVARHKSFIASVQAATSGNIDNFNSKNENTNKRKRENNAMQGNKKRRKNSKIENTTQEYLNDNYCWECHREGQFICCEMCPRVFHLKCAGMDKEPEEDWACSECHAVMQAENIENRSRAMQMISVDQLCVLLKFALTRLVTSSSMEPFRNPVDVSQFPTYRDMVVHPVDFTSLDRNIKRKFYGSTEAFLSDARWIYHNSVIFNGANSKVTTLARTLIRTLKQELSEIETCPDCYLNAHQLQDTWFKEACRLAHPLVWARLKGFPFWPAKAVKWKEGNVDVRFFGKHDRSWVPLKECFLLSEQMPTSPKNRNKTLESCLVEVSEHIEKLSEKFGKFNYAPHRMLFNPYDPDQIKNLLPHYKGPSILKVQRHPRSSSRQSGYSGTDDETSSIASTDSAASSGRTSKKGKPLLCQTFQEAETEEDISSFQDDLDSSNIEDTSKLDEPDMESELKDEDYLDSVSEGKLEINANDVKNEAEEISDMSPTEEDANKLIKQEFDVEEKVDPDLTLKQLNLLNQMEKSLCPSVEEPEENQPDQTDPDIPKMETESAIKSEAVDTPPMTEKINDSPPEISSELESLCTEDSSSNKLSKDKQTKDDEHEDKLKAISDLLSECSQVKTFDSHEGGTFDSKEIEENEKSASVVNEDNPVSPYAKSGHESPVSDSSESKLQIVESCEPLKETPSGDNKATEEGDANDSEVFLPSVNGLVNSTSLPAEPTDSEEDKNSNLNPEIDKSEAKINSMFTSSLNNNSKIIDENIRNLERLNELLQWEGPSASEEEEDTEPAVKNAESPKPSEPKRDESSTKESAYFKEPEKAESPSTTMNEMKDGIENKDKDLEPEEMDENDESEIDSIKENEAAQLISKLVSLSEFASKKNLGADCPEEDYFQGFLNDPEYKKKLESYKEIFKSIQLGEFDETITDAEDLEEGDELHSDKLDFDDDIEENLLKNSSLTVDKIMPKKDDLNKLEAFNDVSTSTENIIKSMASFSSVNISRLGNKEKPSSDSLESLLASSSESKKENSETNVSSSESNSINLKNYTDKILHNVTIKSKSIDIEPKGKKDGNPNGKIQTKENDKSELNNKIQRKLSTDSNKQKDDRRITERSNSTEEKKEKDSDSLLEAVRLVQNIGNIAIKRVDSKTLEHTSGNDKITISVANSREESSVKEPKKIEKRHDSREGNPLSAIGSSVSVTKASDKDKEKELKERSKMKMPSGVDTTRLSPSISIIPVSSSSEKPKSKNSISPAVPCSSNSTASTTTTTTTTSSSSKSVSPLGSNASNSSISASPNIPPPPLLSHPLPSPTGNIRGLFGPHLPGLNLQSGPRTPITSPGLRMLGTSPIMMGNRLPTGNQPLRHLPPEAGPLSGELHKHAHKLAEMMRSSLEEVLGGLVGIGTPEARLAALQLELERCNWRHQQELAEVRHNADVMLVEMRANLEAEKQRALEEVRRQMEQKIAELRRQMEGQLGEKLSEHKKQWEVEKQRAVEETKKKQWCANCSKEALFFCCWNTSYCDYPCQQAHWPQHMTVCGQNSDSNNGGGGTGGNTNAANSAGNNTQNELPVENVNGETSTHSSRVTTPVQNIIGVPNPSPIYHEGLGREVAPSVGGSLVNANAQQAIASGPSPLGQTMAAIAPAAMRPHIGNPTMAMAALNAANSGAAAQMGMKMPRFMQHNMIQQQPMFGGMDPRMMMMMGRNMPGPAAAAMMRSHIQPFRPRFM